MQQRSLTFAARVILMVFYLALSIPCAAETITITAGEWAPYLSASLKHHGIAGRIITEAFSQAGIDVKFRMLPWKRAYNEAEHGKVEATGVWLKNPKREKIFYYSGEVIVETHVFFYKKGLNFDWETAADIVPFKLGGLLGFSYGQELDKLIETGKVTIERVNKDEQNFQKLLTGRIALCPQEINVGYEVLYRNFLKGEVASIDHHAKPFLINPSYLLFPKQKPGSQRLQEIFNAGLAKLKKEGKIEAYILDGRKGAYTKP